MEKFYARLLLFIGKAILDFQTLPNNWTKMHCRRKPHGLPLSNIAIAGDKTWQEKDTLCSNPAIRLKLRLTYELNTSLLW